MTLPLFVEPIPKLFVGLGICLWTLGATACTREIGDPCKNSLDCAPQRVDRVCDSTFLVNGEGECTMYDCRHGDCPDEAVCILVYNSEFLTMPCDPAREDLFPDANACEPHQSCLPEGRCADFRQARSSCRLRCSEDKDCRTGYRCIDVGDRGLYLAPDKDLVPPDETAKICVPAL